MKRLLVAFLILGGCSGGDDQADGNALAPAGTGKSGSAPALTGEIGSSLMGLYEGGDVSRKNQLCIVDNQAEQARFGLVVWGANQNSCSGSGTAVREGDRLQLKMAGDETCTIEARIDGRSIILPESVPDGCAYYCGANARLAAARFDQVGTAREDAAKAKDLVGDPLC